MFLSIRLGKGNLAANDPCRDREGAVLAPRPLAYARGSETPPARTGAQLMGEQGADTGR
ncbi:MAG: hypothetical protein GHCLOJNM_02398 [bacterium]|nr:hypothetical protein [bacterium]